jgi:Protein of unknown function (DUF3866)
VLSLRRGVVLAAGSAAGPRQDLEVRLGGDRRRAAAETALVGPARSGDEVLLALAPVGGGPDAVHANLTRGLRGDPPLLPGAAKLAGTSLGHGVRAVELARPGAAAGEAPVAVVLRHAQIAPLAWAFAQVAPGARLGLVQSGTGALPAGASRVVGSLKERALLAGHVTAGAAFGGDDEALTCAGGLAHGFAERHWHAAVCAPGADQADETAAGGRGAASDELAAALRLVPDPAAARVAGLVGLEATHAAASVGCRVVIPGQAGDVAGDTVLERALVALVVAGPGRPIRSVGDHEWRRAEADLDGYASAGLPAPGLLQDAAPFAAALAAGRVLAELARGG